MDPILGGLLMGGANLLGSVFGTTQNNANAQLMQQQAEQYNTGMVQQQEAFQTQMSNTAYQRASADMKAAGLNPASMFGSGGPASSPSGATATIAPAQRTSALTSVGPAMQTAIQSAQALKTQNATIDNLVQENANLKTKNLLDMENIVNTQVQEKGTEASTRLKDETLHTVINDALKADNEAALRRTPAGRLLDQAGMAGRKVSDIISPVGNLVSSAKNVQSMFSDRFGNW